MMLRARVLEALGTVYDPELDEPITTLGFVGSCVVTDGGDVVGAPAAAHAAVRAELRVPDGRGRARRGRTRRRGRRGARRARGPLHGRGDQRRGRPRRGVRGGVPGRDDAASWTRCASCSSARRCWRARLGCARAAARRRLAEPEERRRALRWAICPTPGRRALRRAGAAARASRPTRASAFVTSRTARPLAARRAVAAPAHDAAVACPSRPTAPLPRSAEVRYGIPEEEVAA